MGKLPTPVNDWLYVFIRFFSQKFNNCRPKFGGSGRVFLPLATPLHLGTSFSG